jgi:hypothetical protein
MKNTIGPLDRIDEGFGFVLYDNAGKPCAAFVYPDREAAANAADFFTDVLVGGVRIVTSLPGNDDRA